MHYVHLITEYEKYFAIKMIAVIVLVLKENNQRSKCNCFFMQVSRLMSTSKEKFRDFLEIKKN